jgi:4-alpha-glucanotransferase
MCEIQREAGILMSLTSLPSAYGIGCLSREAYEFCDRLAEAGQSVWQILPLTPTSYGD